MNRKKISVLILIIFVVLISIYIYYHQKEFAIIKTISFYYIIPLFFLAFIPIVTVGITTALFVKIFKINLSVKEWLGLTVIGSFSNYFTPFRFAGASFKAVYLKKKYNLPYSSFLSIFAVSNFIWIFTLIFWGIFGLVIIYLKNNYLNINILIIFLILAVGMIFIFKISPQIKHPKRRLLRILQSSFQGWKRIKKNKPLLLKIAAILSINYFTTSLTLYFALLAFNVKIDFFSVFIIKIITGFSSIVSITPANLGIQETITGTVAALLNIGEFHTFFIAAGLVRVVQIILVFSLSPVYSYILLKKRSPSGK